MIDKEISNLTAIDTLIRQEQPFAVYRIPGEAAPHLLMQATGNVRLLHDLEELDGERGFVIAPFRVSEESPIVMIQPEEPEHFLLPDEYSEEEQEAFRLFQEQETFSETYTEGYETCFRTFIEALRSKRFDKLVLSRKSVIGQFPDFSPSAVFHAACKHYIHSYVYLCYTPRTGVWMGSTPEIILSGEKNEWSTVALAGTLPLQNGNLPQEWGEKNRQEQEYVVSYIRRQLLSLDIHPAESGPYPAYAGALSHLKTSFHFTLRDNRKLGSLLKVLHPTPAVCGLPKEEAYRFILENEGYDRRYYSGFIGWLDPSGKTDLYVNLRCMHIENGQLSFYAGGGLLASSELNDEWLETEKKLQTMKRLLRIPSHDSLTTNH